MTAAAGSRNPELAARAMSMQRAKERKSSVTTIATPPTTTSFMYSLLKRVLMGRILYAYLSSTRDHGAILPRQRQTLEQGSAFTS